MLKQWLVSFSVDGRRSQQVVSAYTSFDAKKLIQAQFVGRKITFWGCKENK